MAKIRTIPWKTEDHLETLEDIAAYLEAVFEDGDPELIGHALGAVARSKGMTGIAQRSGLGRQSLYKALSTEGRPEFATVLKVVQALGLKLTVAPSRRTRAARGARRKPSARSNRIGPGKPSPKRNKRAAE
jgi:probable addiction module antidote protein